MAFATFGSGVLVGARTDIAGATPRQFATLQDVAVDFKGEIKQLYGQYQFPEAVARGKTSVSVKAKYGRVSGALFNDLFFGQASAIGATLAFSVVRTAVRRAVNSADPGARYFAVACAGALAAILVHSLADFNLYIPANAMLLAWIVGMTAGARELPIFDCRLTAEDVAIPVFQSPIVNQRSTISNHRR